MGNSHSQHHQLPISQWTHSYPRTRHPQPQVKVLPQRIPPLQLRTTDNGAILQNGGTISGRKPGAGQEERFYRPRSSSAHRPPKLEDITLNKNRFGSEPDLRFHLKESRDQFSENAVRQRISRSRKKYKAPPAPQNGLGSGVENSSPDLNGWETNQKDFSGAPLRKNRLFKTRAESSKKNLPSVKPLEKEETELIRHAEDLNILQPKFKEERLQQSVDRIEKKGLKRSVSQEVISTKSLATPEFQAELMEAAQRLRPAFGAKNHENQVSGKPNFVKLPSKTPPKEVLSSLNIEIPKDDFKSTQALIKTHEEGGQKNQRNENPVRADTKKEKIERDVPSKKFYFGMKENSNDLRIANSCCVSASTNNVDKTNAEHRITAVEKSKNFMNLYKMVGEGGREWEDTVDKFAANFHMNQVTMSNGNTTSCSSSFISDPDEDVDGGIALQLRPTLPKKQLEIPRFSPTAAWRQLSSIETSCSQAPSPGGSDDGPLLLEDQIHPPVPQQGLRGSHDKSGDSGISGDASPGGCHESSSEIAATSPKTTQENNSKNILMAWTPQQDLEEESSSDDLESPLNSSKNAVCNIPGAKFSPRGQLFLSRDQSFSVPPPREERISRYNANGELKDRSAVDIPPRLNSLKKFRVNLGTSKRDIEEPNSPCGNWVLSRSVPGSLNNSHPPVTRSISNPSSPEQDEDYCQQAPVKCPSYSYLANGGRMMYLPEYHSRMSPDHAEKKQRGNMRNGFLSKSCENITQSEMKQIGRSRSPSPALNRTKELQSEGTKSNQKKKKFTFQSTVRLLENKRIAERLSREAELKENQRLSELEAMKKVEEEFQKKRAREKANIRHQLRLFSLEEKNYSSLPPIDWENSRVDTEEAPSSLPPSGQGGAQRKFSANKKPLVVEISKVAMTPTTQVLSEFREPMRDYKDYRHSRYHEPQDFVQENNNRRSVVEHPRVVYDMPKNTAVYVSAPANPIAQNQHKDDNRVGLSTPRSSSSDNYRKNFAHGATSGRSFTSSDSELSQSHFNFGSRQGMSPRGFGPPHRSRSASPESITGSRSSPRGFGCSLPRSRSSSPAKMILNQKSRSISPNHVTNLGNESSFIQDSPTRRKLLERKLSNPNEYRSAAKNRQIVNIDENSNKQEPLATGTSDTLLRFKLPSLQPFNKAEKSFRPINFNPVNKLAQTVT